MTRATDEEIKLALMKANAAILDAEAERDHWRNSFGLVQAELRVFIGIMLKRNHAKRMTISAEEAQALKRSQELYVSNPEPGVRCYELREGKEAPMPASDFILPRMQ